LTVPAGIIHAVRNVDSGNPAELATYVVEDETTEVVMSRSVEAATNIRPFRVEFPADAVEDLRRRIAAARWPSKELVADRSQGVQIEALQALTGYWLNEYDFGRVEARLNALPQFVTEIDGVDVHFIHIRSPHDDALPLIMTHGWPGSVIEMLDSVGPLTDPTAHGGSAEDGFHLVLPSLPGYGFSSEPVEIGWDLGRTARAWAELMRRLGYTRFVAQGGDVGAGVTDAMGRQEPAGLIGIHTNLLVPALSGPMPTDTDEERAAAAQIATFRQSGNGYFVEMATRPQTIGYALLDSPIALAAWMVDHDTDAYYKIASAFVDGRPSGNLTRDHILDNITLYWLTGSGASTSRSYWEAYGPDAPAAGRQPLPPTTIPFAFTTFPGEIWRTPRSWVEASYPNVTYFHEVDKGGHFAAWEEPELFSTDIRAAFRSLR
jgi:pimeloyl-ACP methyl ester carboxylesterase